VYRTATRLASSLAQRVEASVPVQNAGSYGLTAPFSRRGTAKGEAV
jgi:hypothetical protein